MPAAYVQRDRPEGVPPLALTGKRTLPDVREYRAEELAGLLAAHFGDVELYGVRHARKLRAHDLALRLGWDRLHPRLGLTGSFYGWFGPAISVRDFRLRRGVPASLRRALDFVAVCRP